MKALFIKMFFVLFILGTFSKAQDFIKNFDGIPIETGLHWDWVRNIPSAVDSMIAAGINIVRMEYDPVSYPEQLTYLNTKGLKIIPSKASGLNYIHYYTDAKYCIWQAEGLPSNFTDANLEYNTIKMDTIKESGTLSYVKLKQNYSGMLDTLINGPYYRQDLMYYSTLGTEYDTVDYQADFYLKLESINIDTVSQDTPICILQVTQSKAKTTQLLQCTDVIDSIVLTREYFTQLNTWYAPNITYRLRSFDCPNKDNGLPDIQPYRGFLDENQSITGTPKRQGSQYIQYKVIWLGNPDYTISIDKIVLSDERGREFLVEDTLNTKAYILQQASALTPQDQLLTGWLGFDEPTSLDIFAPIKRVSTILDGYLNKATPLWLPWMGFWDGAFESRNNTFGSMSLSPWAEFKKRVGRANIIQDGYLYDSPCYPGSPTSICTTGEDIRSINIWRFGELLYKQAYELDPYFGASIQCGAVDPGYGPASIERNVEPYEILYNVNLALMYGAKFLSLYTFFAQRDTSDVASGLTYHGIIDHYPAGVYSGREIYTNKYYMLRYTLNPRLKGLFGKTLKQLVPVEEVLGKNASTNYNLTINRIERVKLANYYGTEALNSYIDIGTFNKPGEIDDNYFMVINRWYSDAPHNKFYIQFRNLCDFRNWHLMNYVDTTSVTLVSDINGVVPPSPVDTILIGDAILYSIKPVAEFGGKLIANETVNSGTTLLGDMSIESGATLTINGRYYANADITIKSGGKIKYGNDNSKIIFTNGAKLIVEGNAQVLGLSNTNKLILDFSSSPSEGVLVKSSALLTMSYCDIRNVDIGIKAENGSSVNISNVNFNNCVQNAIVLFGSSDGESNTVLPTPIIYRSSILGSSTGISAVNCNQLIIKENTITQSNLGIFLNMVNSAYVSSNTILGWQSATGSPMPGISMSSSGGYLRNNTIRYHNYGVMLTYSSPDLGVNTIANNYKCGVYSSFGSFPNLVQQLANPQCWYPIGGCNVIKNNGTFIYLPSNPSILPDGAEIFLNSGDVLLSYG